MPYTSKFKDTLYNPDWLRRVYVEEGRNAAQVAELIGCTNGAVLDNLRKHKIPLKSRSDARKLGGPSESHGPRPRKRFLTTLHNESWLREHYVDKKMTATEMAHIAGCSIPSVLRALRVADIEIRPLGEERRGKPNLKRRVPDEEASTIALRVRARRKTPPGPCAVCGERGVDVNHRDRNPRNLATANLERLCVRCHRRQHTTEEQVMIELLRDKFGVSYLDIHKEARRRLLERQQN